MKNACTFAVSNLACSAGEHRLFAGLTLQLSSGQGMVITGPNGAGKTTLLRTLAGLKRQDEGTIIFSGLNNDAPVAHGLHYIGHRDGLRAALTVRENLVFAGDLLGAAKAMDQAAERLAVTRLLDLPVGVLSAGQRRRAALARLLVSNRPLWLLDEPTAALDTVSHGLVEALIAQHLDCGGMVMAATHLPLNVPAMRGLVFKTDGTFELGEGL